MFQYIVQTVAFQLFFLMVYDFLFKRETFFNWNRAYLLGTPLLSLLIPLIKIDGLKNVVPQDYIITLPEVFIGNVQPKLTETVLLESTVVAQQPFWSWDVIFLMGALVAFLVFVFKFLKMFRMLFKNPKKKVDNLFIIELLNSTTAFSFFRYIFLGALIDKGDKETILKHEIVHVRQYHSLDLLFFEILRVIFWFNPLIYMYQNRMVELHEFIADSKAINPENKQAYYDNLLSQVFETQKISFINPFFKQSLIKKRIVMLTKSKSKQINLLKYALLVPLILGMLVYTSTDAQIKTGQISKSSAEFQDLSDQQLKDKFYKEILDMKKKGATEADIISKYKHHSDKYIISKEEYYRNRMFYKYILMHKENVSKDKISKDLIAITYNEYLDYKKTEEAKRDWENKKNDVLRLVVDDLNNISVKDNLRYNEKLKEFQEDDNYLKFVVTDGKSYSTQTKISKTSEHGTKYFLNNQNLKDYTVKVDLNEGVTEEMSIRQEKFHAFLLSNPEYVGWIDFNKKTRTIISSIHSKNEEIPVGYSQIKVDFPDNKFYYSYTNSPKNFVQNRSNDSSKKYLEKGDVPFAIVEQVPVFPGCENLEKGFQKPCMSKGISKFVNKNFNTKIADSLGLVGRQRINVIFKIDKKGNVTGVRSRAPHPALEDEAIRVIKLLPKMIPGEHDGKKVNVPYSLPIVFQVTEKKPTSE